MNSQTSAPSQLGSDLLDSGLSNSGLSGTGLLGAGHPLVNGGTADSPLVQAARGFQPERTPVWFMRQAGADVMGVDFRLPLDQAAQRLGGNIPLQGNLDPAALFVDESVRRTAIDKVLDSARDLPGHIFNLGHGVPPTADPGVITSVVEYVHQKSSE